MAKPTIETERLILRPLESNDLDFLLSMHTDVEIMQYTGGVQTVEEVTKSMPDKVALGQKDNFQGIWVQIEKETSQPIGSVGLFGLPLNDVFIGDEKAEVIPSGLIEIGYRSVKSAWGKGYNTESAKAVLDFGFENSTLSEIVGCTDHPNEPSKNILKKIGMSYRGERTCYGEELPFFEITREEWEKGRL